MYVLTRTYGTDSPIDDIPGPHWDPKAPTLRAFLEGVAAKSSCTVDDANTRVNRLHYIQRHTLGMPNSFGYRREEIALLEGRDSGTITDTEVVDHFLRDVCDPSGALRQYLEHAVVAARIGNTVFVHGAIDECSAGFVPSPSVKYGIPESTDPGRMCEIVDEWVVEMNDFLRAGLADFALRPDWDPGRSTRGGEALMALQNRESMSGRTVVSSCYGDGGVITTPAALGRRHDELEQYAADGDVRHFGGLSSSPKLPSVNEWLRQGGVHRVVVGHKPTGDCPAVLAGHINGGVEIVSCDTSFSDMLAADTRGVAASAVTIIGAPEHNRLVINGVLKDGAKHHTVHRAIGPGPVSGGGDMLLGTATADGWWFKACIVVGGGDESDSGASTEVMYRQTKGVGRRWETRDVRSALPSNHL